MSIKITGGGSQLIRVLTADPTAPNVVHPTAINSKDLWVLWTKGGAGSTQGVPMGLLLSLTYANTVAGGADVYQLSANTTGGIVRSTIP